MPSKDPEVHRRAVRKWNAKNPEKIRKASREWKDRNRKKISKSTKQRRVANPEKRSVIEKRSRSLYPERVKARALLDRAVRSGKVERLPCQVCGTKKRVHGHHEDYDKPLEVIWLCAAHHGTEHRKEKERPMKQSLNEEQMAQGNKDIGRFHFPIYKCAPHVADDKHSLVEEIFVEAERFIDARMYAERHFGVPQVTAVKYEAARIDAFPRWQVRWAGNAASGSNNLRRQVRRVPTQDASQRDGGWENL